MAKILKEKIDSINERLRSFGKEAVQETKMTDKDGKVIVQKNLPKIRTWARNCNMN